MARSATTIPRLSCPAGYMISQRRLPPRSGNPLPKMAQNGPGNSWHAPGDAVCLRELRGNRGGNRYWVYASKLYFKGFLNTAISEPAFKVVFQFCPDFGGGPDIDRRAVGLLVGHGQFEPFPWCRVRYRHLCVSMFWAERPKSGGGAGASIARTTCWVSLPVS